MPFDLWFSLNRTDVNEISLSRHGLYLHRYKLARSHPPECLVFTLWCLFLCWKIGLGYFNRPGPEVDYFHSETGPEVTFWNCTAEPQTPNCAALNFILIFFQPSQPFATWCCQSLLSFSYLRTFTSEWQSWALSVFLNFFTN